MPIFPLLKPIVMYLIPDDFSPERLKGKTIEQVCYSINQIGLFWENGNIQIMGSFSFSHSLATGEPMCTKRFIPSPKIRDYYVCCSNK